MKYDHPSERPAGVMSERRVTIVSAVLAGLGPASLSLFTPAMPEIVHAFGTTEDAVKMTLGLYFAGFAVTQLVCGPLADGFGRKPVTLAFLGIYLVGSLGALLAPSIEVLILSRLLQGAGAAVGLSLSRAIVRDLFAHEQSARILNLITLILALAPALAPTIGGLVMQIAGWHAIFSIMFLMGIAALLTVRFALAKPSNAIRAGHGQKRSSGPTGSCSAAAISCSPASSSPARWAPTTRRRQCCPSS
ncbi:MFS transporter [Mesorhizobium sp. CC13]|uniref:MFS transporter n=1 Tax=Mesorhizobium sp. CC13 TaxID=3029194 RepID=UPI0032638788